MCMDNVFQYVEKIKLEKMEFANVHQDFIWLTNHVNLVQNSVIIQIYTEDAFVEQDSFKPQLVASLTVQINNTFQTEDVLISVNQNMKYSTLVNANAYKIMKELMENVSWHV